MMQRLLLAAVTLGLLTGCVDTMDSVSREYRNTINECIDAMMMITTEKQAEEMTLRVFKPSSERFQKIDFKLKGFEANRTKMEFMKEAFEANGVHLLFAELEQNRQRYALEKTRLRSLRDDLVKAGKEKNPEDTENQICPKLVDLLRQDSAPLKPVEMQLKDPAMMTKISQIMMQLKPAERSEMGKLYTERSKAFHKGNETGDKKDKKGQGIQLVR